MNAIGASELILLVSLILFTSRRWALVGMMTGMLYLTHAQVINLFGFNLFAIRFLELAGFIRVLVRKELLLININRIDRIIILLYSYSTLVFLIRSKTDYAYSLGMMVDAMLCYFTFRALVRNVEDLKQFLYVFVAILCPYVILVAVEMMTHKNPFALIGGLSFVEREGRLRCMGSFRHPALLGTLGAVFLPLYIALAIKGSNRIHAFIGIGLCLAIVYLANSGGPLSAAAMGLIAWIFWIFREKISLVRHLLVIVIIILAVIMKAPIWYLPAKISAFTGGDGWHRSYLMDVAFRNIHQWWLAGMDIEKTYNWFPYAVDATGGADITNQFLSFGLEAGLLAMALFIVLIVSAFQAIGHGLAAVQSTKVVPSLSEYLLWGLGCVLVVHISTWFGITYTFDQTYVIWFMQLAAISSIAQSSIETGAQTTNEEITLHCRIRGNFYKNHRYRKSL